MADVLNRIAEAIGTRTDARSGRIGMALGGMPHDETTRFSPRRTARRLACRDAGRDCTGRLALADVDESTTIALAVSLHGHMRQPPSSGLLSNQTVKLAPVSLLQPEVRAEFPVTRTSLTVTQLVVQSSIEGPTFRTPCRDAGRLRPRSTSRRGQQLKVVYSAPTGQQGAATVLRRCPDPSSRRSPERDPDHPGRAAFHRLRRQQVESRPARPAAGGRPVIWRKGKVVGDASSSSGRTHWSMPATAGGWWSIGPLETIMSDWHRLTSGPSAQAGSRSDVGTPPTAPTTPR